MFLAKFTKLIDFLRIYIRKGALLNVVNQPALVRETVFFAVNFFHRGSCFGFRSSAGQSSAQVEGSKGFLLKLTLTKTTRGSATSPFILEPFEDHGVCPVAWIEYYLSVCKYSAGRGLFL